MRVRVSVAAWQQIEARKAALPKTITYQNMTAEQLKEQLPTWVISLKRATTRRANMLQQLKKAGDSTVCSTAASDVSGSINSTKKILEAVHCLQHACGPVLLQH